jgi:hypothetical protein
MKTVITLTLILFIFSKNCKAQIQPKVLWETVVDSSSDVTHNYSPAYFSEDNALAISPNGNIVTAYDYWGIDSQTHTQVISMNKVGKINWSINNLYKNANSNILPSLAFNNTLTVKAQKRINSVNILDSTFVFNTNFELVKSLPLSIKTVNDGFIYYQGIYNNDKKIIKFDVEGKEQWTFKDSQNRSIIVRNENAPYLCEVVTMLNSPNAQFTTLDQDGKLRSISKAYNYSTFLCGDSERVWAITKDTTYENGGFSKIDLVKDNAMVFAFSKIFEQETYDMKAYTITPINNKHLLISFLRFNQLHFCLIDSVGNVSIHATGVILPPIAEMITDIKFQISGNNIMFIIPKNGYPYNYNSPPNLFTIGVLNVTSTSLLWLKNIDVGSPNYYGKTITFQPDNSFLQLTANGNDPNIDFTVYELDGRIRWQKSFKVNIFFTYQWKKTNDYLYLFLAEGKANLAKINYKDGNILWAKEEMAITSIQQHIKTNTKGEDIIFSHWVDANLSPYYTFKYIKKDGSIGWIHKLTNPNINESEVAYVIENETIIAKQSIYENNQSKVIIAKITPCSYNFSDKVALPDSGTTTLVANSSQRILCNNERVSLTAPKYDGAVYEWRRDGKVFASGNSSTQEVNQSGTYQVAIKDTICLYSGISNALTFTVQKKVSLAIDAPSTSVCEGEKITLAAKTTENSYFWQKDSQFIASASPMLEPKSSGFYRLASYNEQCKDSTFSNTIAITIKPLPDATVEMEAKGNVFNKPSVKLTARTGNGIGYQWYKDDVTIPNATRSSYESYVSGVYKVNLTQNGCTQTSKPLEINIFVPLANEKEESETQIKVYPNPSNGQFSVTLPESLVGANLELFDGLGKKIDGMVNHETIHTSNSLPAGTYVLKITKNEKITSMKVIVE